MQAAALRTLPQASLSPIVVCAAVFSMVDATFSVLMIRSASFLDGALGCSLCDRFRDQRSKVSGSKLHMSSRTSVDAWRFKPMQL
jgi:hypothetical protein